MSKSVNPGAANRGWPRHITKLAAVILTTGAVVAGGATASFALARSSMASPRRTAATSSFLACEVTDSGTVNDKSFNAAAYQGLKVAAAAVPGLKYTYLPSPAESNYVSNINTFLGEHCGIIVTVGYLMAQATQDAAKKNPSQKFTIVDDTYSPPIKNILGLHYDTDQDGFLGGYLAAAMSKTGIVGTFGGEDIPTVTIYMSGWVAGVRYYNVLNHAHVKVLGWDPNTNKGTFTNDFTSLSLGYTDTKTMIAQGADVIFPVAGGVGLGAAKAVKQAGKGYYMEWVDTDGCVSAAQYCSIFITSVTKGITASVSTAVERAAKGTFKGGDYNGTLANKGVSLAPYHDFANVIPAKVKSEITTLEAKVISGKLSTNPLKYPVG